MKRFVVKAKVWKYPGMDGWHFVYVGDKESAQVKKFQQKMPRRGFGSVHVRAILGATTWDTSIFPTKEGPYLLPLKANIRKKEAIYDSDKVEIKCALI